MTDDVNVLSIDLGKQSYDIMIGHQLTRGMVEYLDHIFSIPHVIIITDEHVASHYLRQVQSQLEANGLKVDVVILPPGEKSKSFETFQWLMNQLLEFRPERRTTLLALGGGVVGDITGFAASILLRGVPFIQVPTTLLAQIDSSVGGKTGINTAFGKNLIGTFYQPRRVLIDTAFLQSLPMREFQSGLAEVIKYALIMDKPFFSWLYRNKEAVLAKETEALKYIITKSCQIKAKIVTKDEKEHGIRALLNLGHTFGHALEAFLGYTDLLLHGEAVALGMVLAADMSVKKGWCNKRVYGQTSDLIKHMGLPTSLLDIEVDWDIDKLIELMRQDKKVSQGKMVFILLTEIGKAKQDNTVEESLIREVLKGALS